MPNITVASFHDSIACSFESDVSPVLEGRRWHVNLSLDILSFLRLRTQVHVPQP